MRSQQRAQALGQALGFPPADDVVFVHRGRGDIGLGCSVWRGDLGPGRASGPVSSACCGIGSFDSAFSGNAEHQCGRECCIAFERFFQSQPAADLIRTGGLITGIVGLLMMPWKLLTRFQHLHFRLAGRLFRAAGTVAGIMIADYFFFGEPS